MSVEEAIFLYEMNKNITAEVDTPHGMTEPFLIEEAVRQGTVLGTTLCGISTNRINKMGTPNPLILYNKLCIETPIFVDDMMGMGSKDMIENTGYKMRGLETTKKFEFNNKTDKTEILTINNRNKKNNISIDIKVRNGKIRESNLYKCLGDYYHET